MSTKQKLTTKVSLGRKTTKTKTVIPSLILAAENGDVESIEKLIRDGADVHEISNPKLHPYYGADALTVAARHGHLNAVQVLLGHRANVTYRSAYGSAIQQAIDYGHADVVRLLLKHGAYKLGYSLFNAINQNNVEIFRAVSEAGISLNDFRERRIRQSLLEYAIHRKKSDIVGLLLDVGVKLVGGELVECAARGNAEIARKLITRGAKTTQPNRKGRYPLSSACYWGNKEVAEVLLEHGASLATIDSRGWSCFDWARYGERKDIMRWLDSIARQKKIKIPKQKVLKEPEM